MCMHIWLRMLACAGCPCPPYPSAVCVVSEHAALARSLSPAHLDYLRAMPLAHRLPDINAIIVHAGLIPAGEPPEALAVSTPDVSVCVWGGGGGGSHVCVLCVLVCPPVHSRKVC